MLLVSSRLDFGVVGSLPSIPLLFRAGSALGISPEGSFMFLFSVFVWLEPGFGFFPFLMKYTWSRVLEKKLNDIETILELLLLHPYLITRCHP